VAIVRCLRERRPAEAGHGRLVAVASAGLLGFLLLFEYVGAAIASALFMLFLLSVVNRGRTVANVVLAVLIPAAVYVVFEVGLNAGLPPGPLPVL
jgi:putative tricarboxylic transport membrane protein